MPADTVGKFSEALRERGEALSDATVAVLGFAYRHRVDEKRESPGVAITTVLRSIVADVVGVDPLVDPDTFDGPECDETVTTTVLASPLGTDSWAEQAGERSVWS